MRAAAIIHQKSRIKPSRTDNDQMVGSALGGNKDELE
jgi:hypothetical protein